MFISIEKILGNISDKDEIIFESNFRGVETSNMVDCDIIAISHAGRRLLKALPAYYTDDTKKEIIVYDPRRSFKENITNKIALTPSPKFKNESWHIHEIDGCKFTMVTVNILSVRRRTGLKYWPKDNWL